MVRLWDLTKTPPQEPAILQGHRGAVQLVLFPPDGHTLVSVADTGGVIDWEFASGERLQEWLLPGGTVGKFACTLDGRYLAMGKSDGTVSLFRAAARSGR
jgi:WD40 repeat protein